MASVAEPQHSSFANVDSTARSDSLIELGKAYPRESVRFLELTTLLGGICGGVITLPSCILLLVAWERSAFCERPLRLWLLVVALLHLVQTPLRLFCYRWLAVGAKAVMSSPIPTGENGDQMSQGEDRHRRNNQLSSLVAQIVQSPAWRGNEWVSAVSLGWLIVGVVWIVNASPTPECPEAYYLTLWVLVIAGLRLLLSASCFRSIFSEAALAESQALAVSQANTPAPMPAGRLEKLPSIRCNDVYSTRNSGCRCSVCLGDFDFGQELRLLPCNHYFHKECVDPWLLKRCDCPLCRSTEGIRESGSGRATSAAREVVTETLVG